MTRRHSRSLVLALTVTMAFVVGCTMYNNAEVDDGFDALLTVDEFMRGNYAQITELPEGSDPFQDLDPYGLWYDLPPYGWVWRPTVTTDWHPNLHGEWLWTEMGWTWLSYDEFGWATSHYGSWILEPTIGWVWIPDFEWKAHTDVWALVDNLVYFAPDPPAGGYLEDIWDDRELTSWIAVPTDKFAYNDVERVRVDQPIRGYPSDTRIRVLRMEPPISIVDPYQRLRLLQIKMGIFTIDGVQLAQIVLPGDFPFNFYEGPPGMIVPVPPAPPYIAPGPPSYSPPIAYQPRGPKYKKPGTDNPDKPRQPEKPTRGEKPNIHPPKNPGDKPAMGRPPKHRDPNTPDTPDEPEQKEPPKKGGHDRPAKQEPPKRGERPAKKEPPSKPTRPEPPQKQEPPKKGGHDKPAKQEPPQKKKGDDDDKGEKKKGGR